MTRLFGLCGGDLRSNFALLLGDAAARAAYSDEAGRPGRMHTIQFLRIACLIKQILLKNVFVEFARGQRDGLRGCLPIRAKPFLCGFFAAHAHDWSIYKEVFHGGVSAQTVG